VSVEAIRRAIRDIPDFPVKGILFKDITPVLGDAALFRAAVDLFAARHAGSRVDVVAAIEARGFLFGAAVACRLGTGVVPIRKKGKLPYKTVEASYELEYGSATLQMHVDAIARGARVLVMDDLLATGGTASAGAGMIRDAGGEIVEIDFLVELAFLKGRERLAGWPVFAPIVF
jgi:adenine phosphoribosyltransferase